jgi:hypothetical protein
MPKKQWEVTLGDRRHAIELDHSEMTGSVKIRVDGERAVDERTVSSADFRFEIAGRSAVVRFKAGLLEDHDYRLLVDGAEVV